MSTSTSADKCFKIDRPRRQAASPKEKALHICQSSEIVHEDDFEVKFINRYKGRGVFAKKPFQNGEFLLQYKGELVSYKEGERRLHDEGMGSFLFFIGRSKCVDATNSDGLGRMVNDSRTAKQANTAIKIVGKSTTHLCLFARRDIVIGEELMYYYGPTDDNMYWRLDREPVRYYEPEGQKTNTCTMRTRNSSRSSWMTSGADMNNTSLLRAKDSSISMQAAVEKIRENRKKFPVDRKRMLAAEPMKDVSSEVKSVSEAKVPKRQHPSKVAKKEFLKEEPKRLTEQVDIQVKEKQKLPMFENRILLHGLPEEDAIKRVLEETEKKKAIPRETKLPELTAPTKPGKVPEKPAVVTRMKKPQVTKILYPVTAQEGEKVNFDVKFKGHPEPVIKLYKDDINTWSSTDLIMSLSDEPSSLTIAEIFPEDSGIYKCIATNADGSTSTECKLDVIGGLPEVYEVVMESVPVPIVQVERNPSLIETVKPAFVDRLNKSWLMVGTSIIFDCCVVGQPIPEVYWTEGDNPIKPDSRHKMTFDENTGRCTLIISHCRPDDAGAYTCHAINSVGEASTSAALLPAERKAPPPAPPPPIVCTNAPHLEEPSTFPPSETFQELQQLDLLPLCVEKDFFIPISEKILESNVAHRMTQQEEEEMQPVEEEAQPELLVQEVQNLKEKGKFSSDIETLQYDLEIDRLSPNQTLPPQFEQFLGNTLFTGIITGVGDIQAAGDRGYITGSEDESGSEIYLFIL